MITTKLFLFFLLAELNACSSWWMCLDVEPLFPPKNEVWRHREKPSNESGWARRRERPGKGALMGRLWLVVRVGDGYETPSVPLLCDRRCHHEPQFRTETIRNLSTAKRCYVSGKLSRLWLNKVIKAKKLKNNNNNNTRMASTLTRFPEHIY